MSVQSDSTPPPESEIRPSGCDACGHVCDEHDVMTESAGLESSLLAVA